MFFVSLCKNGTFSTPASTWPWANRVAIHLGRHIYHRQPKYCYLMIDKTCVKLIGFTLRICKDVNFSSRQMLRCLIRWWAVVHRSRKESDVSEDARQDERMYKIHIHARFVQWHESQWWRCYNRVSSLWLILMCEIGEKYALQFCFNIRDKWPIGNEGRGSAVCYWEMQPKF